MKKKTVAISVVSVAVVVAIVIALLLNGKKAVPASTQGKSAYDIAVMNGYSGTQEQWLASLVGENGAKGDKGDAGKSAYELAVENGYKGTVEEWLKSLVASDVAGKDGANGKSAYELAVEKGYNGTEEEWLKTLVGANGIDGKGEIYDSNLQDVDVDYVFEYVSGKTSKTTGIQYITDSLNGTAKITGYVGESADVIIPSYVSDGKQAYKVTEVSAKAFAGKPVRSVVLGEFIETVPDGAFKNCTKLEEVIGSFTEIGNEAFAGCTKLTNMNIPSNVVKVGADAFKGANSIRIIATEIENLFTHIG